MSADNSLCPQYRLSDNVRLVAGAKEWAVYKLDTHDIIRVSPDEGRRIQHGDLDEFSVRKLIDFGVYRKNTEQSTVTTQSVVGNESAHIPFRSAWLELTDDCNLSCSHCYMNAGLTKMTANTNWGRVLEYLATHHCHNAIFIGGEPLCHPKLLDYLEYAKRLAPEMKLCVVTNGTLWNEGLFVRMKELDVFLKFSLLGSSADRHDEITGVTGSFSAAVTNLDLAIRLGVKLEISTTLVSSSRDTAESMKHFVSERFGVVKQSTTRVRPKGRQTQCGNLVDACSEEHLATHISKEFFGLATHRHPCLYGKAAFSHLGFVYPCIMSRYEQIDIETVLEQAPEDVFCRWWTLTKDEVDGCRDCALRYACFDCRGFATSMTGCPSNCRLAVELAMRGSRAKHERLQMHGMSSRSVFAENCVAHGEGLAE